MFYDADEMGFTESLIVPSLITGGILFVIAFALLTYQGYKKCNKKRNKKKSFLKRYGIMFGLKASIPVAIFGILFPIIIGFIPIFRGPLFTASQTPYIGGLVDGLLTSIGVLIGYLSQKQLFGGVS